MAKLPPMMLIPPLAFFAMAGLFAWGVLGNKGDELPTAIAGQAAPMLPEAPLGARARFTASDLAKGEVSLVNFWASWCAPCRVEHPNLGRLAAQGIAIYGVNYKDKAASAEAFLTELGDPYRAVLRDENGQAALQWGVYGVPETYVIDGQGRVMDRIAGPVTERMISERLRPLIEAAGQALPSN